MKLKRQEQNWGPRPHNLILGSQRRRNSRLLKCLEIKCQKRKKKVSLVRRANAE